MTDTNPARALNVVQRMVMMCAFFDHTAIKTAVEQAVPVTMPRAPGALGFDIPLWVGLGMVGLWAALDGFADRAGLKKPTCTTCRMRCIPTRFASYTQGNESQSLKELEDLRHLTPTIMQARPMTNISQSVNGTFFNVASPHNSPVARHSMAADRGSICPTFGCTLARCKVCWSALPDVCFRHVPGPLPKPDNWLY
jgi:hypothetical protein